MCSILSSRHHSFFEKPFFLWGTISLWNRSVSGSCSWMQPRATIRQISTRTPNDICILQVTVMFKCLHLSGVHSTLVKFPQGLGRFLTTPHPCYGHAMKYPCKTRSTPWPLVKRMLQNHYSETLFAQSHWHILCHCNWQDLGVNRGSATWLWQLFPVQSLVWARQSLALGLSNPLVSAKYCMHISISISYTDTMSYSLTFCVHPWRWQMAGWLYHLQIHMRWEHHCLRPHHPGIHSNIASVK